MRALVKYLAIFYTRNILEIYPEDPPPINMERVRDFLKTRTTSCLPPSPLALPITGHLHLLTPISHQALRKLSKQYRPLIHIFLGSVPCVLASSPETAKEVLKTNEPSLSNRSHIAAANYLFYRSQDLSFAPYGSYWKFMKKLCRSEHLGGRTLDLLLSVRRDKIRRRIDLLSRKGKAGEAVDIGGELMRVTNNVISRMIMSERCSENKDEAGIVRKLIKEMSELTGKFKGVHDIFDAMLGRIVEEYNEVGRKMEEIRDEGNIQ
ncbi:hypothetical protein RJ639_015285 [Escallonia herrerae]|uniref:Uncharacterized protein n=1 Tax=Escallonia herrerae TaxID=1293975 RepID=A0AA88VJT8_9ASTE|nr:hypothetical protein RJ639_015285 [Escallonia herrerae]